MHLPGAARVSLTVLMLWLMSFSETAAQKPPALGYVYPPAVSAGTDAQVELGGFDLTSDMQWFVHDDRIRLETAGIPGDFIDAPPPYWTGPRAAGASLPIPREVPARLKVPADMPSGLVRWQVANANGSSGTALFFVGDAREITESRSRSFPQRLPPLPVAVSGRLSALTEVDRYEIETDGAAVVSVEVMARRLGADFQSFIEVHDSTGKLLADFSDTQGQDGHLTFFAPAAGIYTVSIRDVDFRGDRSWVYRLAITSGPRVVCSLPACMQRGCSGEVMLIGYGLQHAGDQLQNVRRTVTCPSESEASAVTVSVETRIGSCNAEIPLSDLVEATHTHSAVKARMKDAWAVTTPVAVTAQLAPESIEHRYFWQAEKDQYWRIQLQSRAVGGCLDVATAVLGPAGQAVAEADDSDGTTDASLEFRAAETGEYCCVVRSVSNRTGSMDEIYRLELRPSPADFSLAVPQQINVPSGGRTEFTVQAVRAGGFSGEIALSCKGLPVGMMQEGNWVIPAGAGEAKVTLTAAMDAAVVAGMLTFQGTSSVGDQQLVRTAAAVASGNLSPRHPREGRSDHVLAAMTMTPPFDVQIIDRDRQHEVSRGTTFPADIEIVRRPVTEGGPLFDGEIQLVTSASQQRYRAGIRSAAITVPAGISRTQFPCFMPEWLATDLTQRMLIHGVAQVPDPRGNLRQLTKAGNARITMIMEGALLKLSADKTDFAVRPGDLTEIPVQLLRSPAFSLPVTVQVMVPKEAEGLLSCEPLILASDQNRGTLRLMSQSDDRLIGPWLLRLTATALQDNQWPVISEREIQIEFRDENQMPLVPAR